MKYFEIFKFEGHYGEFEKFAQAICNHPRQNIWQKLEEWSKIWPDQKFLKCLHPTLIWS